MKRIAFDTALRGLSGEAVLDVAWRHYRTIELLEMAIRDCPQPDEEGSFDIGQMMTFCENVAALRGEEK